jgi:ketosteroid isomerase-like protein
MTSPTLDSATGADPIAVAKKSYQAYVDKDRAALEQVIVDDFHFSSPLDNRIDRRTYFARCWPNSENIADFKFIHLVNESDRVFVTYEGHSSGGKGFRNTEILTIRDGKLVEAEVYFGWPLPHEAPPGGFTNPGAQA